MSNEVQENSEELEAGKEESTQWTDGVLDKETKPWPWKRRVWLRFSLGAPEMTVLSSHQVIQPPNGSLPRC